MPREDILAACAAKGYKVDSASYTISGLTSGVAFRIDMQTGNLEMSVNVPANRFDKLRSALSSMDETFQELTVSQQPYGIRIFLPSASELTGEAFVSFIEKAATKSVELIGNAYNDHFEKKQGEPMTAYITGLLGALLGAVAGVLPWFIASRFLNFQFGWLAFLVSTGAFFGYRWFRGAHNTSYAMTVIVLFSLMAMFLSNLLECGLDYVAVNPETSLLQAMLLYLMGGNIQLVLSNMLFGVLFAALGLVAIRGRVLAYTHEPWFLRRKDRRK